MQDHPSRDQRPKDPQAIKQAVLSILIHDYPALWSLSELDRTLTPGGGQPSRPDTEDAVADLYAAGLLHRSGEFVFASRAAIEAERISA